MRLLAVLAAAGLAAFAIAASLFAEYAQHVLLDTGAFTERATQLAADAQTRSAIAAMVTDAALDSMNFGDLMGTVLEAAPANLADELAGAASDEARGIVADLVEGFLSSSEFQAAWEGAVRETHADLVAALHGEDGGVFEVDGDALAVDLGPITEAVQQRLAADGIAPAADPPAVEAEIILAEGDQVSLLQRNLERLELAATLLPWAALALVVFAFALAPLRRQAALAVGGFSAAAAAFALVALSRGRASFAERAQGNALAPTVFDAFTGDLVRIYQVTAVAALLATAGAAWAIIGRHRAAGQPTDPGRG